MNPQDLKPNIVVRGPMFPEPVKIIRVVPMGGSIKLVGQGMTTGLVHQPILSPAQLANLEGSPELQPFDGDATKFKLGVEALRLGIAYEYDPYFSLSIARVDPLPHQLEAVYDYFLRLPRIRFLLADDPGAGKTIMAGLLIKELKIRGLVKRILIVTPANLTFQWQRELKDKFQEKFEVIRSDVLRANYGSNPWQEKNQVVTSISWVSRIEDAKESLLRSHWDLIIVDEAHKMSAYSSDKKTLAYELGESAVGDDRPLPPDDRDAAQGRPGELPPVPATARPGCLRRRGQHRRGHAQARGTVLPAPGQGSAGPLSRPGHWRGQNSLHQAERARPSTSRSTTKSGTSTTRSLVTSRTSPSRRRPTIPPAAAPSASRWPCCSAGSPPASTPSGEAWSACGTSAQQILGDPAAYRQQQIDARVPDDFDDLPGRRAAGNLGRA